MSNRGSYIVRGLGNRKQAILDTNGTVLDIAIAMLESDDMAATYRYGDGKTGDAANFGIFKQNWLMIRSSWKQYANLKDTDYNLGAILNKDLKLDIRVLHGSQAYYGLSRLWFAGHRNGQSGLDNPNTPDIATYRNAVHWIRDQLNANSKFRTDDTRFWVRVKPI
jgi:hypothetical protein